MCVCVYLNAETRKVLIAESHSHVAATGQPAVQLVVTHVLVGWGVEGCWCEGHAGVSAVVEQGRRGRGVRV